MIERKRREKKKGVKTHGAIPLCRKKAMGLLGVNVGRCSATTSFLNRTSFSLPLPPPCEMELWFQCRVTRSHAQVCMKQKGMFLSLFDKDGNSSPHKDEKMTSFRSCVLFLLLFFLSNNNPNCRLLVFFVSLLFFSPFFPLPFSLSKNVTLYTSVCVVVIVICFRFHVEKAQKRKLHYSL